MSWFDDVLSAFGDISVGNVVGGLAVPAATYGIQQLFPDFFDNQRSMAGYQGGIPEYTATRQQVPGVYDLNRRPGGSGRRYFTDVQYTPVGIDGVPSALAAANEAAATRSTAQPLQLRSGGIASMAQGRYLNGTTDGMADKVPANIGGMQEARLSDGEFVIPADVVGHLGNGNSNAGAEKLHTMMDRVRKARTGSTQQGKQINSSNMLPA